VTAKVGRIGRIGRKVGAFIARRSGVWLLLSPFLIGSTVPVAVPIALTVPLALTEAVAATL
jgi:hypothetical protein